MVKFEIYKEYSLKLGKANPIRSIYLGINRSSKRKARHVFLVNGNFLPRAYSGIHFYLGYLDKTTFKDNIVYIKDSFPKWINPLEKKLIESLIDKLENQ